MRVAEALVSLLLGMALLQGGAQVLARAGRASGELVARADRLETYRLVGGVLDAELAGARAGIDWSADPDGLSLRVFRGWGAACVAGGPGVVVAYRGLRRPEPDKDSLELVLGDGRRRWVALAAVESAAPDVVCPAPGDPVRLRWSDDVEDQDSPSLARVFERGLYAVTDAFRYRRGAGGRQPLTPASLDPGRSSLTADGGAPEVTLVAPGGGPARTRRWVP
jgi:hypothetical protein